MVMFGWYALICTWSVWYWVDPIKNDPIKYGEIKRKPHSFGAIENALRLAPANHTTIILDQGEQNWPRIVKYENRSSLDCIEEVVLG